MAGDLLLPSGPGTRGVEAQPQARLGERGETPLLAEEGTGPPRSTGTPRGAPRGARPPSLRCGRGRFWRWIAGGPARQERRPRWRLWALTLRSVSGSPGEPSGDGGAGSAHPAPLPPTAARGRGAGRRAEVTRRDESDGCRRPLAGRGAAAAAAPSPLSALRRRGRACGRAAGRASAGPRARRPRRPRRPWPARRGPSATDAAAAMRRWVQLARLPGRGGGPGAGPRRPGAAGRAALGPLARRR